MPDDERAIRARLDALEAEVKADAEAARVRKEAALAKVREQRASQLADKQALRDRQAELVTGKTRTKRASEPPPVTDDDDDDDSMFAAGRSALRGSPGSAMELARKAQNARTELTKPRKAGDKSWKASALLSLFFGPVGWLYAGSLRETIPAAAAWLAIAAVASKVLSIFSFLFLPVLAVAMPISAIVGILYATGYNKTGKRQRLFTKAEAKGKAAIAGKKPKQLPSGR